MSGNERMREAGGLDNNPKREEPKLRAWDAPHEGDLPGVSPTGSSFGTSPSTWGWSAGPSSLPRLHGGLAIQKMELASSAPAAAAEPSQSMEPSEETSTSEPDRAVSGRLIVDDGEGPGSGQMRRSDFLAELKEAVCRQAEEGMASTPWSAEGCPWIERWFAYYGAQDAAHVEAAVHKYAPETRGAATARDYIPLVAGRVRTAVDIWARTGRVTGIPDSIPGGLGSIGSMLSPVGAMIGSAAGAIGSAVGGFFGGGGRIQAKSLDGGIQETLDPISVRESLGAGQSLDAGTSSRLGSALGEDFSGVRVHTDGNASELNRRMNARAFTVGNHIAFGHGQFNPGTPEGDGLLAHELAHVAQQSGATTVERGASYNALERDAEQATAGAVARMYGGGRAELGTAARGAALAQARSGLTLQRCGDDTPSTAEIESHVFTPVLPFGQAPTVMQPKPLALAPLWDITRRSYVSNNAYVTGDRMMISLFGEGDAAERLKGLKDVSWFVQVTPSDGGEAEVTRYSEPNLSFDLEEAGAYIVEAEYTLANSNQRYKTPPLSFFVIEESEDRTEASYKRAVEAKAADIDPQSPSKLMQGFSNIRKELGYGIGANTENDRRRESKRPYVAYRGASKTYHTSKPSREELNKFRPGPAFEQGEEEVRNGINVGGQDIGHYELVNPPEGVIVEWYAEFSSSVPDAIVQEIASDSNGVLVQAPDRKRISIPETAPGYAEIAIEPPYGFIVACEITDKRTNELQRIEWVQVVHGVAESQLNNRIGKYVDQARNAYAAVASGKAIPLKAAYISKQTREPVELNLYYGPHRDMQNPRYPFDIIVDITPWADVGTYGGKDFDAALGTFIRTNAYPPGYISLFKPGSSAPEKTFETPFAGMGVIEDIGDLGDKLMLAGTLLGAIPGVDIIAPVLLIPGFVLSSGAKVLSLIDKMSSNDADWIDVSISVIDVVTSIAGAFSGRAAKGVQAAAGRFWIPLKTSGKVIEGVNGILLTADAVVKIKAVVEMDGMPPDQRTLAIISVLVQLGLDHSFTLVGNLDLFKGSKGILMDTAMRKRDTSAKAARRENHPFLPPAKAILRRIPPDSWKDASKGMLGDIEAYLERYKAEDAFNEMMVEIRKGIYSYDELMRLVERKRLELIEAEERSGKH